MNSERASITAWFCAPREKGNSVKRISRSRLLLVFGVMACFWGIVVASDTMAAGTTAWAPIAGSGPTNLPSVQSEVQRVGVDAEGGSFTLTAHHIAAQGNGSILAKSAVVKGVVTSSGAFVAGQKIEGFGIPDGTTIISVGSETLVLSAQALFAEEGVLLTATDGVAETTPLIAFNAPAKESEGPGSVEAALNGLGLIDAGGGKVSVIGGPGDKDSNHPFIVTFDGGPLASTNVPQLSANGSTLTGGGTNTVNVSTTVPGGSGTGEVAIYTQNIGGKDSEGIVTVHVQLPFGVTTTNVPRNGTTGGAAWNCVPGIPGQSSFTCTTTESVAPGGPSESIVAPVTVAPGTVSGQPVKVEVTGGGASGPAGIYEMPLTISALPAPPGIQSFIAGAYDENGKRDERAGAHPANASTGIIVNTRRAANGAIVAAGEPKDIMVDLPPGFLGNPIAVPQCPDSASILHQGCSRASVVGKVKPIVGTLGGNALAGNEFANVYNIAAPFGYPAKVKFIAGDGQLTVSVIGQLRSDKDYGITFGSPNTAQILPVKGAFFDFWGNPASSTHDVARGGPLPPETEEVAFATEATNCAEEAIVNPVTTLNFNTWQSPLEEFHRSVTLPPVTECENLKFEAATPGHPGVGFTFEPSDTKSDSPASFRTELTVPSEGLTDPAELTTPEIKEAVVKLPEGVSLNPSGADGLQACSETQIGLKNTIDPTTGLPEPEKMPNPLRFTKDPNQCPEASTIGSGELKSALLENPLHGALYLAAQGKGNPFGSLFAVYLVIEDPQTGIFIKLPGEVEPNKATGQFQVSFHNLPQLPFTYLKLTLKGGNRSALASPTTCGNFVTTAVNTPWSYPESGPPAESSNGFAINQGPNGQPCAPTKAARPFNLGLSAGTESIASGTHSPLTFQVTRPDGSQELNTLDLGTAPGLSATLKGIPECTATNASIEAKTGKQEEASPSCPVASQIGRTLTGAGAGPTPFYTAGKLYLAGPYKGAPLSVVAITPAVAGPFDLGNVVVRTALFVNRQTAQVNAKTDPIPQILEGVPLRIKDVRVILDRKDFSLNPTSCDPSAITVHATGNSGASTDLSAHFQVSGCGALKFKPNFSAKVSGSTKRNSHPAFTATVTYPEGPGYANIKDVQVALPHSEFLDQSHINTVCTRVQATAHECPKGSIYGEAEATTPLLDGVLKGPVFLKSSSHQLPDLAIALKGPDSQPIEVEFAGRIDSVHGQIRDTIEGLPDVPVSSFVLRMQGGKKGLLVNSRDLCKGKQTRMTVNTIGQNNKRYDTRPKLGNDCGKKSKAKKGKKHASHRIALADWVPIGF
jgi:hypothetical protein